MSKKLYIDGAEHPFERINVEVEHITGTGWVADEYEMTYIGEGIPVPIPQGRRKPRTIVYGKETSGRFETKTQISESQIMDDNGIPSPVTLRVEASDNDYKLEDTMIILDGFDESRYRYNFVSEQ